MRRSILLLCIPMAGCDLLAPGASREVEVTLPFCEPFPTTLSWAAIKGGFRDWERLTVSGDTATFTAPANVTIAYGNARDSRVYSVTADELRDITCFRRGPETRFLDGSTSGTAADEDVFVTVGPTVVQTPQAFTVFVPDGPLEIVGRTYSRSSGTPRRVIVRHDVDYPTGTEIPRLEFASAEAREFESANIAITGHVNPAFFSNNFWASGMRHELGSSIRGNLALPYYAVPPSLLGANDYHSVEARIFISNGAQELAYYYLRARDAQVALGPEMSTPTVSIIATTPCIRMQAMIPAQSEYPSFVIARFVVNYNAGDASVVEVGVTRKFLGRTPSTWTVETPDLRRPDGSCLLRPNPVSFSANLSAQDGRIALHLGGKGRDGEVRRWATLFLSN